MRRFPAPPRHPPLFLPELAKCLVLPGVFGNNASTPDSVATSILSDIDIRVKFGTDDWTPATTSALVGKSSYLFYLETTGQLLLRIQTATVPTFYAVNPGIASNGVIRYFKVTLDIDNGVNSVARFYESTNDGISWNQISVDVLQPILAGIDDSPNPLQIGAEGNSGNFATGQFFYAEVRNGIDGPVVASFNPNRALKRSPTVTSPTGEVWTVNTSGTPKAYLF